MFDPQSLTGHSVRRWNYPPDYRLPSRMPEAVRRAIKAIEADDTRSSPVPGLTRELAARCRDFRRIDALYAASSDSTAPAHTYWPEAYLGVIETADWLCFEAWGPPSAWAHKIFPSEMRRMNQGVPTDAGLSDEFKAVLAVLEDRLARVARTSHNEAVLFEEMPTTDRMPDLQAGMCLAAGQALENLNDVFEWARDAYARTQADRLLKMRVIEIEYGPPQMVRLHAKSTMHLHSRGNLLDLRDIRRLQGSRETRMKPRREDYKYWSWIYRNEPFAE